MKTKYVSLAIYVVFSIFLELSIAFALPLTWYWKGTIMTGIGVILSLFGRELMKD
jgi:hypothetical protein